MTFTEWLSSTLGVTASGGILLTGLGYLFRHSLLERLTKGIQHEYDLKLETHKANLQRDYEIQLERLRADAAQNNIRLAEVFSEQAHVIEQIHSHLHELRLTAIAIHIFPKGEGAEKFIDVWKTKYGNFNKLFYSKKIYLPSNTGAKVREFVEKLSQIVRTGNLVSNPGDLIHTEEFKSKIKELNSLHAEIPNLLSALEQDFQRILGFSLEAETSEPVAKLKDK